MLGDHPKMALVLEYAMPFVVISIVQGSRLPVVCMSAPMALEPPVVNLEQFLK
jgi:hypothetical protein